MDQNPKRKSQNNTILRRRHKSKPYDCRLGNGFFCLFILFYFKFIYFIYIYFWLHWVFIAACGLSLVAVSGGYSLLQCVGFSLRWLLLLWSTGSRRTGFSSCGARASAVVARGLSSCGLRALECRLSSCGTRA